ncbi:hypothetical protein MVEN_00730300 [Mycena venus]|uniref:Uncharacterized protein n=1 Tax=Mycena venus TaxID=2733690 RepID=A0A8H7D5U8_9AGAR|nr:hypothetical protein MVEN_00730300 [Mycena venus]
MTLGMDSVRSANTSTCKIGVPDWLLEDPLAKLDPPLPNKKDKVHRGMAHPPFARAFTPMEWEANQITWTQVVEGNKQISCTQLLKFIFPCSQVFPVGKELDDPAWGVVLKNACKGESAKAIFMGPDAALEGDGYHKGKLGNASIIGMTMFTPRIIAGVITQDWNKMDGDFDYEEFFWTIHDLFDDQDFVADIIYHWNNDPKDVENLMCYFHTQRSRFGNGGNPDRQLLNDAATYLRSLGPPKHGGPKTPDAIKGQWIVTCKLHDYIQQALQKTYPGASGWTYTHELGFNITPESEDAWHVFLKVGNSHFKPFANKGWDLWELMHEILPTRAKGKFVVNAASGRSSHSRVHEELSEPVTSTDVTQLSMESLLPESQLSDTSSQASALSQPLSNWSQSDYGHSQSPDQRSNHDDEPAGISGLIQLASAVSHLSQTPSTTPEMPAQPSAPAVPPMTPANPLKCATSDETDMPWGSKRTKTTGPEVIMFLGCGVMDIGGALRECFGTKSSGLSLSKKVVQARKLAEEDVKNNHILSEVHLWLSLLFGRDISAADAYIADGDDYNCTDLARILLPNFYF